MNDVTLNQIKTHLPCKDGWEKLLKSLGKTKADDEPVALKYIVESNGVADAIWCLRVLPLERVKDIRLFAADVAESVLHVFEEKYPDDKRPRKAIEAARAFAYGTITLDELKAAYAAAYAAATTGAAYADGAAYAVYAYAAAAYAVAYTVAYADVVSADAAYAAAADAVASADAARQKQLFLKYFGV